MKLETSCASSDQQQANFIYTLWQLLRRRSGGSACRCSGRGSLRSCMSFSVCGDNKLAGSSSILVLKFGLFRPARLAVLYVFPKAPIDVSHAVQELSRSIQSEKETLQGRKHLLLLCDVAYHWKLGEQIFKNYSDFEC